MKANNFKQRNEPSLNDVLQSLKADIFKSMNCIQIAEIQSFDPADQTVSALISIKQILDVDLQGVKRYIEYPVLLKCPAVSLSGGEAHLTIPPVKGDSCIIFFNDRDIDNWFIEGGTKAPNTTRRHDLSDGLALVGIRNLQNAIGDYLADGVRLQFNATNKMELKSDVIETTTPLLKQNGDQETDGNGKTNLTHTILGGLIIGGTVTQLAGGSTPLVINAPVEITNSLETTGTIKAGNGATGTFTSVTVVDGIVTGGS